MVFSNCVRRRLVTTTKAAPTAAKQKSKKKSQQLERLIESFVLFCIIAVLNPNNYFHLFHRGIASQSSKYQCCRLIHFAKEAKAMLSACVYQKPLNSANQQQMISSVCSNSNRCEEVSVII
ncbi:hypothetical protein GQX74_013627 [Glossina fuscipes]|nr:hypothetical protein GQX74_013627 [Glossina fuscipes]